MSTRDHLTRADIVTMIEDFLTRKLSNTKPELAHYALNTHAVILAKLRNQRKYLGYDFSFIEESIENLGNAEAIKTLDTTAQLILSTSGKRKHENTKALLDSEDIDTAIEESEDNDERERE